VSVEYVIERAASNVRERLSACGVTELVYAAALFGADPEALFPSEITLGLERDRAAALASPVTYDAFWRIWEPEEMARSCPDKPSLYDDPEFLAAQRAVWEPPGAAWEALGEEPRRYVLNRVAARVTAQHPLPSVTDDFVGYAFAEDFGEELIENITFSAGPEIAHRLRAKGVLPDDPASLPGHPGR
jgi:hypothetical protein